jgi:hypothetical protein
VKKKYTGPLNVHSIPTAIAAVIAAWLLPALKERDHETRLRRMRVIEAAVDILMWRWTPKRKRSKQDAADADAAMRWLLNKATPLEFGETTEILANGLTTTNKWHLAALLSWIHARKEKGKDWKFQDVVEKYQTLREQNHWNDLPDIWRDSKTGNGSDWSLRRVLIDLGILPKKRTR